MLRARQSCPEVTLLSHEVFDQTLALEVGQRGKLFLDRALARPVKAADAQVDHIERINPEVS